MVVFFSFYKLIYNPFQNYKLMLDSLFRIKYINVDTSFGLAVCDF